MNKKFSAPRNRHAVVAALMLVLVPFPAWAGVITPVSATSTSTIGGSRTLGAAIDGTLLSSGGTSGDILSETVSYAGSSGHWLSASSAVDDDAGFRSTTEVLTFDLGGAFEVRAIHLWPYIRVERARGIRTCDISFSTDGGATYPVTIPGATLGDFTIGNTGGTMPVQTKTFATQSGVTHIRMDNLTTFSSTNYIAISELRFGSPDSAPPTLASTDPADDATSVVVSSDLTATFTEDIALVDGGTVTIRNLGPGADEVITIPDGRLTLAGRDLVINPSADLALSTDYAVQISADAIVDLSPSPNAFAGILDDTTWNFQTAEDATAPSLVLPTSPAGGATEVPTGSNLVATFDEPIAAGSGDIFIRNLTESTETVIPVGDARVSVAGTQLTINPTSNLDPGDEYAVQLATGAVTDLAGNPFAGILDDTTWNFTTLPDTIAPTIANLAPADDAVDVSAASDLVATFDEPVVAATPPTVTLLSAGFESSDGGFTVLTTEGSDWVRGTPDSFSPGATIDSGNGAASGSGSCWGTNLGAYAGGAGDEGYYAVPTTTCLRSGPINLTTVATATLTFAQARDLDTGDTAVVNIIDDTTDTELASAIYTATGSGNWGDSPAIDLADGVGDIIRIEWCLTGNGGGSNDYLGWYVDDVVVTGISSTDAGITLKNLTTNTETVFAPDDPEVLLTGNTLTVEPGSLEANATYAVRIGPDALTDLSGNPFAGIADDSTWNFRVAAAANIITPVSAVATSSIGSPRTIDRTIDGSDLSGGGTSGDILAETHVNNSSNSGGYWLSANTGGNVAGEVLTYTLAEPTDVNAVHIWGYRRGGTSRSIRNFDLSFSTDGGATFPTTISLGDLVGPGDPIPVQTLTFSLQSGVTDLRISNITNFGDGNYVGLSEIRFGGPSDGGGGGSDFSDWIAGFSVDGQTGLGDDPDGDGHANGIENFFGTDPDTFSAGLTAGEVNAGGTVFSFTHPQGTLADDLSADYQWSTDLQTFTPNGVANGGTTVTCVATPDTPVDGTTTVTATVSGTIPDALYLNVLVTQNP